MHILRQCEIMPQSLKKKFIVGFIKLNNDFLEITIILLLLLSTKYTEH